MTASGPVAGGMALVAAASALLAHSAGWVRWADEGAEAVRPGLPVVDDVVPPRLPPVGDGLGPLAQETLQTAVENYQALRSGTPAQQVVAKAGCAVISDIGKENLKGLSAADYQERLEEELRAAGTNPYAPALVRHVPHAARLISQAELADDALRYAKFCITNL